jgi:hypothetical protein
MESKRWFKLQGQAGVEILIPLHIDLSVVVLNGLYFSIGFSTNPPPLQIGLATSITANLGPLVATVDHIGINIGISFPPDGKGQLGMADLSFAFAPPKGVGLEVDAGVIVGGGFLYLDPDKGQYYGALELEFQYLFSLKAIGIVNTKCRTEARAFFTHHYHGLLHTDPTRIWIYIEWSRGSSWIEPYDEY